jgi:hypothetical protein
MDKFIRYDEKIGKGNYGDVLLVKYKTDDSNQVILFL